MSTAWGREISRPHAVFSFLQNLWVYRVLQWLTHTSISMNIGGFVGNNAFLRARFI